MLVGSCELRVVSLERKHLDVHLTKDRRRIKELKKQCISKGENSKREAATLSKDQSPMGVTTSCPRRVRESKQTL